MLRFVIVLLLTISCLAEGAALTDEQFAKQVQDFARDINESAKQSSIIEKQQHQVPQDNAPKLIVFVSTSMSRTSLQQWASQAELLGAELVIRGFVNNSFKETIILAQELFSKEKVGGFNIDPFKFKKYKIDVVPTVVLEVGESCDYVRGDIGLIEALKTIGNKGENSSEAQNYLSQI